MIQRNKKNEPSPGSWENILRAVACHLVLDTQFQRPRHIKVQTSKSEASWKRQGCLSVSASLCSLCPAGASGNTRLQCRRLKGPPEQSILSSPGDTRLAHGDSDCPQYSHSSRLRQRGYYYPSMTKIIKGFYPLQPFSSSRHPRVSPPPRSTLKDAQPGAGSRPWERLALVAAVLLRGRDERKNNSRGFPSPPCCPPRPRRPFHLPARGSFISDRGAMGPLRPPPPRHRPAPPSGGRCRGQMAAVPSFPGREGCWAPATAAVTA